MRYHVPRLALGVLLPPQTSLQDTFGGSPFGLPPHRWPFCRECHAPMALIAQLGHHPERLDLGREGRVLFVFQCGNAGECETWSAKSGANAALVLEPDELLDGPTPVPDGAPRETEVRVLGWRTGEDLVAPAQAHAFLPGSADRDVPEDVRESVASGTRLGSVPLWIQSPDEAPRTPWRFVAQLDSLHTFEGQPPPADEGGFTVTRKVEGRYVHEVPARPRPGAPPGVSVDGDGYSCNAANYGDAGIGYVFVRSDGARPEALFFWQGS
jgi:hypothetical protein